MPEHDNVEQLFKRWRNGEREAGQTMAQQFSDWYFAITTVHLGDLQGQEPLDQACNAFIQGVTGVGRSADLVDWAHGLIQGSVAGERIAGGDYPNQLTDGRPPSELLQAAGRALDPKVCQILALAYSPDTTEDELAEAAEPHGGMPFAILSARHQLKAWLKEHAQVDFQVVPDHPNLDCGPLPIYEAARMETPQEEVAFEKWLVSDPSLCRDVAEFAVFAHALRGGALADALRPGGLSAAPRPSPASTPTAPVQLDHYAERQSRLPYVLLALALIVVIGLLFGVVFLFSFVLT